MRRPTHRLSQRQSGFSLIELMVGMTIGLLAGIIIIQVMSLFEAQRRTTTGSADAQTNGGIALYGIARELQMAGWPLIPATDSALECTSFNYGSSGVTSLVPVSITNGTASTGVSASDSITIRFGAPPLVGGIPSSHPFGAPLTIKTTSGNDVVVKTNIGCAVGDRTVSVSGGACSLSRVTGLKNTPAPDQSVVLQEVTGVTSSASFSCIGDWNEVTYSVNQATGNLERTVLNSTGSSGAVPIVVGVVNLQAQYGISAAPNSNQVTQWVDASGGTWAAPTVTDRNRIKAVRIAVIARNAKIESEAVSAACTSTTTASPGGLCAWEGTSASPAPTVDLSQMDPNWARYRYRVFETIIPLRNVIWSKDTL